MNKKNLLALSAIALSIAVIALLAGATPALAQLSDTTPGWHYYSGCANDSGGNPISDGNYDMYFAYYNAPTGGDKEWSEYHDNVQVEDCYFYVKLGETGGDKELDYLDYTGPRYLEVRICNDDSCSSDGNDPGYEVLPRTQMGSSPWTYWAQYASYGGGHKYHYVVAKEHGHFTSVYDAVQAVTDASEYKPYVIWVAPGYYTETQTIQTKPYVHIMGMGKNATYIYNNTTDKTVELGSNTSISDLTIKNQYSGGNSYAIYVNPGATGSYLNYVGAYSDYGTSGGPYQYNHYAYYANGQDIEVHIKYGYFHAKYGDRNYAVYNSGGAKTYIKGGNYYAYKGNYAYGIWNGGNKDYKSYVDVYYVMARGSGAQNNNIGLYNGGYAEAKLNKGYYYGQYDEYGQRCYGIYNEFADLTSSYAYAYGKGCDYNYGLYNYYASGGPYADYDAHKSVVELKHGYYGGYYDNGKGDYCYGIYNWQDYAYNGPGDYSVVHTSYTGAYGEDCRKQNWGVWNQNGQFIAYGGYFYGTAPSQYEYASDQYCGGVYNKGNYSDDYNGLYKGYDVTAYGKYCYHNYGLWNLEYGYAGVYGGTYYAHGEANKGVNNYGFYNEGVDGQDGKVKAAQCVVYSSGATSNYGSYSTEYADTYLDSCTAKGDTNQAVYATGNSNTYVGASKIEGKAGKGGSGVLTCVYTYDETYAVYACP